MRLDLNLLQYQRNIKTQQHEGKLRLYDIIRKKYVAATPEEWVRQLFIQYLINEKNISKNSISIEKQLIINEKIKRFDIVIFGKNNFPKTIIECKSSKIALTNDVFQQAAIYNLALKAPFLIITNGIDTYHCAIDSEQGKYQFLENI